MTDIEEDLDVKLNRETARIHWHELQRYFASGNVINVSKKLDLIRAAKAVADDNTQDIKQWMDQSLIAPASDEQASRWHDANTELWAVVIKPLILVQEVLTEMETESLTKETNE